MSKYLLIIGHVDHQRTVQCQLSMGDDSKMVEFVSKIRFSSEYTTKVFEIDYEPNLPQGKSVQVEFNLCRELHTGLAYTAVPSSILAANYTKDSPLLILMEVHLRKSLMIDCMHPLPDIKNQTLFTRPYTYHSVSLERELIYQALATFLILLLMLIKFRKSYSQGIFQSISYPEGSAPINNHIGTYFQCCTNMINKLFINIYNTASNHTKNEYEQGIICTANEGSAIEDSCIYNDLEMCCSDITANASNDTSNNQNRRCKVFGSDLEASWSYCNQTPSASAVSRLDSHAYGDEHEESYENIICDSVRDDAVDISVIEPIRYDIARHTETELSPNENSNPYSSRTITPTWARINTEYSCEISAGTGSDQFPSNNPCPEHVFNEEIYLSKGSVTSNSMYIDTQTQSFDVVTDLWDDSAPTSATSVAEIHDENTESTQSSYVPSNVVESFNMSCSISTEDLLQGEISDVEANQTGSELHSDMELSLRSSYIQKTACGQYFPKSEARDSVVAVPESTIVHSSVVDALETPNILVRNVVESKITDIPDTDEEWKALFKQLLQTTGKL